MPDLLITDAIVEAATVASINVSLAPYGEAITTTDHLQGGVEALAEMRVALEAVVPLIAAKAWEEGYTEGSRGRMWDSINPYQTRAHVSKSNIVPVQVTSHLKHSKIQDVLITPSVNT